MTAGHSIVLTHSKKKQKICAWSKIYWKYQYVNVINTKDDNHITSDDNVSQIDVGYKNQTFNFMDNVLSTRDYHSSSITNMINSVCDYSLPPETLPRIKDISRLMRSRGIRSHFLWRAWIFVGWLDGMDLEHDDPWHPIGVLLGTCIASRLLQHVEVDVITKKVLFDVGCIGSVVSMFIKDTLCLLLKNVIHVMLSCHVSVIDDQWCPLLSRSLLTPWHSLYQMARPHERNKTPCVLLFGSKHVVFRQL